MKTPLTLALAAAAAFLPVTVTAKSKAAPPTPLHIAVLDFSEGSPDTANLGKSVATLLNAELSGSASFFLVERAELDTLLSEQELTLSGSVTADSALAIGKLTGAQVLVTGRAFTAAGKLYLVAKIISAETGRVFGAKASGPADQSGLDAQITELVTAIDTAVAENRDALVAPAESWDEMIARLKKSLPDGGKKRDLPAVYVKIPEEHLRQAVPDPACQTEIQRVLGDLGFPLAKSRAEADIAITGEAFSQAGARRANLISCRARAEIKIEDVKADKLIAVDRVTVGAIDLAEETAGKSALQKAGLKLAEAFVESRKEK